MKSIRSDLPEKTQLVANEEIFGQDVEYTVV